MSTLFRMVDKDSPSVMVKRHVSVTGNGSLQRIQIRQTSPFNYDTGIDIVAVRCSSYLLRNVS